MEEYLRSSHVFQKRLGINPMPRKEARYLLFRMAGPLMQQKLVKFVDLTKVPTTFIHGNPHLDNYVRTFRGSAMVDFDRSRMGPYCWDIIRFLAALSLRRETDDAFLDRRVVEHFLDAYMTHFLHPDIPSKQIRSLRSVEPQKWQLSTRDYLKGNRKWAKKMRENALSPKSEPVLKLLTNFLASNNNEKLLDEYVIDEVGLTPGSFGKKHFIYSLMPKNPDSHVDAILLDIKEVYTEKDTKFFWTPVPHHGLRMIQASKVFADGMEERLGWCDHQGKQWWGRQIPCFAVKLKKFLDKNDQEDVAYSVGSELGKGHRKGLQDPKSYALIEKDLLANFDSYYKVSKLFTYELALAFEAMRRKIKLYQDYRGW